MPEIFISYSRKNLEFTRKLHARLADLGYSIWIDFESIPPTAEFLGEIFKGIEDADFFVFIISPASASSDICGMELRHAIKHNKRLIPILCEITDPVLVPGELRQVNWIYWRTDDDDSQAMDKVRGSLLSDFEWIHQHTDLLSRALEWQKKGMQSSLLLRAKPLADAEAWLIEGAQKVPGPTSLHLAFIEESRTAQRRMKKIGIGAATVSLLAIILLVGFAMFQANQAAQARLQEEKQNTFRTANALALKSKQVGDTDIDLGILLAAKSVHLTYDRYGEFSSETSQALYESVIENSFKGQLVGHAAHVKSFAESPDGKYFLTGGYDSQVFLWKTDGTSRQILTGHTGPVSIVSFSPDSRHFITAEINGNLFLWNVDGSPVFQFPGEKGKLMHAGFHPVKDVIILVYENGLMEIWSSEARLLNQYPMGSETPASIREVVFAKSGDRLLTILANGHVILRDDTGNPLFDRIMPSAVTASTMSDDSELIFLGLENGNAVLLDGNGQVLVEFETAFEKTILGEEIHSVAINPRYKLLLTEGNDNTAKLWKTDGTLVATLPHAQRVLFVMFDPTGRRIFTQALTSDIMVWDLQGNPLFPLPGVLPLAFINSTTIATGNGTGMSFWDMNLEPYKLLTADDARLDSAQMTGDRILLNDYIFDENGGFVSAVFGWHAKFNPRGTEIVSGNEIGLYVWSKDGDLIAHDATPINSSSFDFPVWLDDQTILATDQQGGVYLWIWKDQKYVEFSRHKSQVRNAAFRNGLIATVDLDDVVYIWDTQGNVVASFDSHHDGGVSLGFMPDGQSLLTSGNDRFLRLWDLDGSLASEIPDASSLPIISGDGNLIVTADSLQDVTKLWNSKLELIVQIEGHASDLSPDGKYILTHAGYTPKTKNVLELWTINGDRVGELKGHSQIGDIVINYARFSSDGNLVITSSTDGEVRLWDLKGQLLAVIQTGSSDFVLQKDDALLVVQDTSAKLISPILPLDQMLAEAARRVNKTLTPYECQFHLPELPCP